MGNKTRLARLEANIGSNAVPTWHDMMAARTRLTEVARRRLVEGLKAVQQGIPIAPFVRTSEELADANICASWDAAHGINMAGAVDEFCRRLEAMHLRREAAKDKEVVLHSEKTY